MEEEDAEYLIAKSSNSGLMTLHGGQLSFVNIATTQSLFVKSDSKEARFVQIVRAEVRA